MPKTTRAEQTPQLRLAALGTLLLQWIRNRLKELELVAAGITFVVVGGHGERGFRSGTGIGEIQFDVDVKI